MVSFLHSRPLGVYENFFENAKKVIDDMKVRLSYGTVGNAEIGDYASMARYENKRLPFGKDMTTIVTLKSMANPDLRWEKSRQLDAGIDLSFFNGRIEFMADIIIRLRLIYCMSYNCLLTRDMRKL